MDDILEEIQRLSNEAEMHYNNSNWSDRSIVLSDMLCLFVNLKYMMQDQWSREYEYRVAVTFMSLGYTLGNLGDLHAAISEYEQSIHIWEGLRKDFDQSITTWPPEYVNDLASTYSHMGYAKRECGQLDEAVEAYDQSIHIRTLLRTNLELEQVQKKCPTDNSYGLSMAISINDSLIQFHKLLKTIQIKSYKPNSIEFHKFLKTTNIDKSKSDALAKVINFYEERIKHNKYKVKNFEYECLDDDDLFLGLDELEEFECDEDAWNGESLDFEFEGDVLIGEETDLELLDIDLELLEDIEFDDELYDSRYWEPFCLLEVERSPKFIHAKSYIILALAEDYINLALARKEIGSLFTAIGAYETSIRHLHSLRSEFEQSDTISLRQYQNTLALICMELGHTNCDCGQLFDAITAYDESIYLWELLRKDFEQSSTDWPLDYLNNLANTYLHLGYAKRECEQRDEAYKAYNSSIHIRKLLHHDLRQFKMKCPHEYQNGLSLAISMNDSVIQFQELLQIIQKLPPQPSLFEYQNDIAKTYLCHGDDERKSGRLSEGITAYEMCVHLQESLRNDCEQTEVEWPLSFQIDLATAFMKLGNVRREDLLLEPAITAYKDAICLWKLLRSELYNLLGHYQAKSDMARTYMHLGVALNNLGQIESAFTAYEEAVFHWELIRQGQQDEQVQRGIKILFPPYYEKGMCETLLFIGDAKHTTGDLVGAISSYQLAIKIIELTAPDYVKFNVNWPFEFEFFIITGYMKLGDVKRASGQLRDAVIAYDEAWERQEYFRIHMERFWSLPHRKTYFLILKNFIDLNNSMPNNIDLYTVLKVISEHLELYPEQSDEAYNVLINLLYSYFKKAEFSCAIQVLSTLQGRELFNRLQKDQHIDIPEVIVYFQTQSAFKKSIGAYEPFEDAKEKEFKEAEIEQLRAAYLEARTNLANLRSFNFIMTPFELSISDLQHDLTPDKARLIWIDLPDSSIQGVLAIPSSGEDIIWVDLADADIKPALTLLTHLFTTLDSDARFYLSTSVVDFEIAAYYELNQQTLGLSDDDIQYLRNWNDGSSQVQTDSSNLNQNMLLDKIWTHILTLQKKIWEKSELTDWLDRHEIKHIYHLSHGESHNKPLTLGCSASFSHNLLPNLSLFRLRQHVLDNSSSVFDTGRQVQIISCPGDIDGGEEQHIPFTILEAEIVSKSLDQSTVNVFSSVKSMIPDHQFPEHKTPLDLLHISCHGVKQVDGLTELLVSGYEITTTNLWNIAPKHTINLTMVNACTSGVVLDNREGDPQGLMVPLLARSKNVISSLLPVNDVLATVFSALFYHFLHSNLTVEQAFLRSKEHIISGEIPEEIIKNMLTIMQPIFEQEALGRNILKAQCNILESTEDSYLLHCLAKITPNVREAQNISKVKGISLGKYLESQFSDRMKLTNISPVRREIAMAGYQLYG